MSFRYGITEEVYILDGERRISYGIAAYSDSETEGTLCIISSVRDISSERSVVESLVDSCNKCSLPVFQLSDVVDDFLNN